MDPFENWALDFSNPIHPLSEKEVYIIVWTNYVTKWVEASVLPKETKKFVDYFL
jgi:hypothetical protein